MEVNIIEVNECDNTQFHEAAHSKTGEIILEPDKEYHLFLSYSSQDEEAVLPILHLLEREPYNFRCCVDRRDFMLGEPVGKNIHYGLSKSQGTVFFLTPTFLDSNYCNHEIQTAFTMYMEGQCRVIPVVLKPCRIPDEFRTIHYIDEGSADVIAEKIFKCLSTDPAEYKTVLPLNPINAGQRRINGNRFPLNIEGNMLHKEGDPLENFITSYQKREFEKLGIQVNSSLIALLKMAMYLPVHHIYYRKYLKRFFFLSSFIRGLIVANTIVVLLACLLVNGYRGPIVDEDFLTFLTAFELVVALEMWGMLSLPFAIIQRFFDIYRSHSRIAAVNQLSVLDKQCCFGLKVSFCGTAILTLVKYDISDCKEYIKNKCEEYDINDLCFENEWSKITKSLVFKTYIKKLCDETLSPVTEERHQVVNGQPCFCQYCEIYSILPFNNPSEWNTGLLPVTNNTDDETVGLLDEAASNTVIKSG